MEIRLDLRIKQDRGPRIYEIEDFDDVLLLTGGIRWDAGNVFEIHLDFFRAGEAVRVAYVSAVSSG